MTGDFEPAVAELFAGLLEEARRSPTDGDARGRLGLAYAASGLRESALQSLEQAIALHPEEPRWWYHAAILQADAGDFDAAIARMDSSLARDSTYAASWWRRGDWLQAQGRLDEAGESFRRAAEAAPRHPGGFVGMARVLLQQGRAEEAARQLEQLLAADPLPTFRAYIHHLLGTAYAQSGRPELAREHLAIGRGGRPLWSDRWAREVDDYRVSLTERIRAAERARMAGKPDEVIALLEPARERHPNDTRVLEQLGVAYYNEGRWQDAEAMFVALLAIAPDDEFVHLHLSSLMQATNRMSEALRLAQRGVELNPRLSRGHRRLAEVLVALGRKDEAMASYEEAMRLDPDDAELLLDAAALEKTLGRTADARALLDRVQEIAPHVHDARIAEIGGNR